MLKILFNVQKKNKNKKILYNIYIFCKSASATPVNHGNLLDTPRVEKHSTPLSYMNDEYYHINLINVREEVSSCKTLRILNNYLFSNLFSQLQ